MKGDAMSKATYEELEELHFAVAQGLSDNIHSEDPVVRYKALSNAVKFLKNNRIKSDPMSDPYLRALMGELSESADSDKGLFSVKLEDS